MFIYKITNTENDKIYIGMTVGSIRKRFNQHVSLSNKKKRSAISNAIKKYGKENFKIEEIGGANSQSELNYQEWLSIHKHNSLAPNGYNLKEGGGSSGKWSEITKKKHCIAMKNRDLVPWNKGTKGATKRNETSYSSETSKGEANDFYGKKHTEETLNKLKKYWIKNCKPIICIETEKEFISINSASREMGLDMRNLSKVLQGKYKTIKGYTFKYITKGE